MLNKLYLLFLCTGNSCRSQMAEGLLRSMAEDQYEVFSAGSHPSRVNPMAIETMKEVGIDISNHTPHPVNEYLSDDFFLVATVCDNAKENCPVFTGICEHRIHYGFEDPANGEGSPLEIMEIYRQVREKILVWMNKLNKDYLT